MLHELVIQEGHPALERSRHAHLVLLHQELDQARLELGLAHPIESAPGGLLVGAKAFAVRVSSGEESRGGQQLLLLALRERGEVVEEERSRPRRHREERPPGVASHRSGQPAREHAHFLADRPRHDSAVDGPETVVPGRHSVAVVAEEELVGPFTGEHDLDVLARETGDEVQRDARVPGDRLVLVPDHPGQRLEELAGRHDHLAVLGPHRACREPGVGELVGLALGEPHGKGADRRLHHRRHERGQSAGVEATGKEQTERHVAHQVALHRRLQAGAQLAGAGLEPGSGVILPNGQLPVAARPDSVAGRPRERPAREELPHSPEEGLLAGDETRGQKLRQDGLVEPGADALGRQDRLDLRREE